MAGRGAPVAFVTGLSPARRPPGGLSHRVKGAARRDALSWVEGAPLTRCDRAMPGRRDGEEATHLKGETTLGRVRSDVANELVGGLLYSSEVQQPHRPASTTGDCERPSQLGNDQQRPACRQLVNRRSGVRAPLAAPEVCFDLRFRRRSPATALCGCAASRSAGGSVRVI
jgi:hypothetical protein